MDVSIMEGRERRAGAVAGVKRVKNPIKIARLVMERSLHCSWRAMVPKRLAPGK